MGQNNVHVSTSQFGTLAYASAVLRGKKNSWIRIFEVTNAQFSLDLSYGMMHHCTKFDENRSRNFCVIAYQTPKIHIFLINKEGGKFFGNMTEALAPPPPNLKKNWEKHRPTNSIQTVVRCTSCFSSNSCSIERGFIWVMRLYHNAELT